MGKILVSGLINIETTVKIDSFPIEYEPVRYSFFGIGSAPSGVGLNISYALNSLGDEVHLLSLIGKDSSAKIVKDELSQHNIDTKYLSEKIQQTSQSVILYDSDGKRQIHCDLKDVQDTKYDEKKFEQAVSDCDIVCLCNINFSRDFLSKAKKLGKIIATDVHVLADIKDEYNSDFMKYADILFMSNENIKGNVEEFVKKVAEEYDNKIIVVGLGSEGALMYVKDDNFIGRFPAVFTRKVINTIGAGDALFSTFIHYYSKLKDPYESIKRAIVFASYKIGESGAAKGFLTEDELEEWYGNIQKTK